MRRSYKIIVGGFIALFLAPNAWAVLCPYEDWPYSSLPMYAHYVSEETPRYQFRFVAELGDGDVLSAQEVSSYSIGIDYALLRYFFKYVYGSVEAVPSPFRIYEDDTPEQFTGRLGAFFAVYAREYAARNPTPSLRGIRLQLAHLRWPDNVVERVDEIGRYEVSSRRFTHTYNPAR